MKGYIDKICCFAVLLAILVGAIPSKTHADGFDETSQTSFRYGPNLSWGLGGNAPFVWGEWVPQAYTSLTYTWLEPLDMLPYGESLGRSPSYLRMNADVEVTPVYCGYGVGIGIRPFKINPSFELNFNYESSLYLRSNLEMVTSDVAGSGEIARTWNADYVSDNIWSDSAEFDYMQLFDFGLMVNYVFPRGASLGFTLHYILLDVGTDFDGKSYDYKRNIPVFSRDFLIELDCFAYLPLVEHFAVVYEGNYYKTGYLRSKNTVEKESLGYVKVLAGGQLFWNDNLQNITLELGWWKRNKERFYDGSLAQQFLIQLEYKGYFTFPFHRNFTE